jgi:hypothetical protein
MKLRGHHIVATLCVGAVFLLSAAWFGFQAPSALAACPTGAQVNLTFPQTSGTAPLTGLQTLKATSSATPQPSGLTFMFSSPSSIVLGQAVQSGTSTWQLSWDSRNVPNGTYQMQAIAHFGTNTSYDCPSASAPVSINNTPTQSPTFEVGISPTAWQAAPNQAGSFTVTGAYVDQFGRKSPLPINAAITWNTNAGSLSNTNQLTTVLTAGTAHGAFSVNVTVSSNSLTARSSSAVQILTTVAPATSPSSSPSPKPTASPSPTPLPDTTAVPPTALTPAQAQQLAITPTIFRPANPTNSDPIVPINTLGCIEKAIGTVNYTQISSGKATPSAVDRTLSSACFSGSDRIPSVLAPVNPTHITELASDPSIITVGGAKNETITNNKGAKVQAILISGTGTPSSSFFLYIFSDPMVLGAQTNSQGKWSYVLENPLKPGHHEIYAVAQQDVSNFVRSPALPISIASAANNQDGSLIIDHSLQPAQIAFIAAAIIMVIVAMGILFRLRRHHVQPVATPPVLIQPSGPAPKQQ